MENQNEPMEIDLEQAANGCLSTPVFCVVLVVIFVLALISR